MKVILHLATSEDGFIAKENGDSDWVSATDEELFRNRAKEAGCLIVGKRTFEQYQSKIYPVQGVLNIVLTSEKHTTQDIGPNVTFANTIPEAFELAKKNGKTSILIAGGARTADEFLEAGFVNEVFLSVHPFRLHSGIKLSKDISIDARYKIAEEKQLEEGVKELHYVML